MVPITKMSSTILEFGEPLFEQFTEPPPINVLRTALKIVITVWNAHALAIPPWGQPDLLANLKKLTEDPSAPPWMAEVVEALMIRRQERFRDDPRGVGEWSIEPSEDGLVFRCDAHLPSSVPAGGGRTRSA